MTHKPMLILDKLRQMDPFLIEARCNLSPDAPEWATIDSLTLEIGYPGIGGKVIWKSIGWLQDKTIPVGRSFAHALWKSAQAEQILVFDFLPVLANASPETENKYSIRESVITADGRRKTSKTGPLRGAYSDEYFTLEPRYPGARKPTPKTNP